MNWKRIAASINSISCPVFGVGWTPPKPEVMTAQQVVTFLEDRRVLFRQFMFEDENHCVISIGKIRDELTNHLQNHDPKSNVAKFLRSMRSACRKCMNAVGDCHLMQSDPEDRAAHHAVFFNALDDLRKTFGKQLAYLAICYGVDIEDELAMILPLKTPDTQQDASTPTNQPALRTD